MRLDAFFDAIDDEDYKLARLIVKKAVRKFPRHPVCFALQGLAAVFIDDDHTDGYLFFNANPVEVATENNEIDLEIRIREGQQAKINKVVVNGNTKTNDHVIMREIRTKPGDLFKRSDIIRTQRELAALNYFNPETLGNIDIDPDPVKNTVNITYNVEEKSSDQLNLQGGWGGGRVIGTLSFQFKNFSTRNIFKEIINFHFL